MLAREPLVHFLAIGVVLFAVHAWRGEPAAPRPEAPAVVAAERAVVVDGAAQAVIAERATRRLGRAPDAAELADETERWIDEEILYHEAIARGLDRDDPMIHERIASRMAYVLEQAIVVPEPDEASLRAWFDAHGDRWDVPERVDFVHVFVAGDDAAARARRDELAAQLAAGAAPERLGDRFSGGHRYRGRRLEDLARAFGDAFADGLLAQAPGTWQPRASRHGLHLVRLDRVEPARVADFAAARLDVRKAWIDERRAAELAAALGELRRGWEIVRP
jgi:hypothetical protein